MSQNYFHNNFLISHPIVPSGTRESIDANSILLYYRKDLPARTLVTCGYYIFNYQYDAGAILGKP